MARQSSVRLHFGRKQSSTSRSASVVARAEAPAIRRKSRAKKWRERFQKLALSTLQSSTILQSICGLFRSSAETARAVRAATGSQIVGLGSRQLRMEGLEQRQMLTTTPWNLGTPGDFSQGRSNNAVISGVDTGSVTEDISLTAGGALSATDVDMNPLSFQPTSGPTPTTYGSYTLDANGNWNYTLTNSDPAVQALITGGATLSDSFNALSVDGTSHQVSITINGNDDVAVITGDSAGDVTEDTSLSDNGTLTATDADAGQSSFQPNGGTTAHGSYTLDSAGNWAYTLDNTNGFVQALKSGQTLNDSFTVVSNDGTTHLVNITINGLDEAPGVVILNGDDNNNSLVIALNTMTYSVDGGTPQSLVDTTNLFFHGWAGLDSIIINGGALGSVTYDYTNANDGDIDLGNGLVLHYTGLDPISNSGTVANAVFNLPATGDNASLAISSPGMLTLSSSPATFESTTFAMPSSGLTVNANNGDDSLSVQPSNGYTVSVDGGSQTTADTLSVDAAGAYAINTGSEIRVQGFASITYAGFEVVNLINPGVLTTLYVDDGWTGTMPGADPDGLGAAINFGVDSFATIQDAINAAVDGATILVHSGLYQEALTIGKSLVFNQLDGVGSVDVDASPTLASNGVDIVPNTTTTPINVSFNGFDFSGASLNGIHVDKNGAALANLILSNSTITAAMTGVWVDGGTASINSNTFTGNGIGVVAAGNASIVGNNFSSSVAGIDVNGGTALVQGNTFTSSIGVRIQNGGIADLGQNGPGINYTGLGVSTGGNTFSSYSAAATSTSGAIVNLNTGGAYSNAGRQGYAGAEKDVAAFNNLWNDPSVTGIENVIWHDADDSPRGFVDYALLSNLVVSLVPLPTIATNQSIDESQVGGTATVYGQFTNEVQAHKVTVSWGDGSPDTVLNLNAGTFTFVIAVPAGTYTDDPYGSVQTIHRTIGVRVEEVANPGNFLNDGSLSVDVNNVIPTATLSTLDNDLNEGEMLSLNIGAKVDPGPDTVRAYRINWGDGQYDVYTSNMSSPEAKWHLYQDGLGNPNRTVTLDIFDEDGTWNAVTSLAIQVHNVSPTAGSFFSFDASVTEGSATAVFFVGPFADPGDPDAPFHFAYDFNGNGVYGEAGESGDGTYAGSVTSTSAIVPASFLADGLGSRTVNASIIDNDGGFTQYSVVIGVDNVAPIVDAGADTTAFPNTVANHIVNFTDPGADAPWTVRINWDNVPGFDETFNVPARSFNINTFSTWMYTNANIGNTYNVQVQVDDNDGGVGSDEFSFTVVEDTLRVTNFVTNNSGFDVTLSRAPNLTDLNLYDGRLDGNPTILDPADVTLTRNGSENIRGSIVWAPDTNTLSFVATGGVLAQGNYSVTLFSSTIAFHAGSNLLDGDSDFNDNEVDDYYTNNFVVVAPDSGTRVVSLPDFSRGPGQAIGIPGTSSILPIKIDSAVGVQAVDVDVLYNPQLMTITAASLGAGPISAGGWSITQNSINIDATHRLLKLTVSGAAPLNGSNVELIRLTSTVPGTATYRSGQVIRLQNLRVNEDLIASKADNAMHKVVYVGDADGDGAYGGADAGLISRNTVNLDSGFDAHDWTDPQIVADASGDGTLSGLDASYVAQEAVFIDVPIVPALPAVPLMFNTSGVDPQYTVDESIHAGRGSSVTVPVQLTVPQLGDISPGVVGSTFDLYFDPSVLTYQSATNGSFWTTGDGWTIFANPNVQPGRVIVSLYNSQGQTSSVGQGPIANVSFGVSNSAPVGNTSTLDVGAKNPNEGYLTWTDNDGSLLFTNFPGDYNQNGIVESGDYVLFRKTQGNSVPTFTGADGDGTGIVAQGDYDLWRANFGNVLSLGAGAGMSLAESRATSAVPASSASTVPAIPAASEVVVEQPAAQRQSASAISKPTTFSAVSFTSVETAGAYIVAPTVATSVFSYESARNHVVRHFADQAYSEELTPSHHSRTAALAAQSGDFSSRLADANLVDLALAAPNRFEMDGDDSLCDDHNADHSEAVDELFAEMDDDALAVRLGV